MYELIFQQWLGVSTLILFISLAIITIIWMIARALDDDNAKKWAQNEIYQVIASAFLLGSVILFIAIAHNIIYLLIPLINPGLNFSCSDSTCTYNQINIGITSITASPDDLANQVSSISVTCGDDKPCHIMVAKSLLDQSFDSIKYYLANKIITVGWIQYISGLEILKLKPFAVGNNIVYIYTTFIKLGFNFLLLLKANSIFLVFIATSLFPAFIISGLVFRSISILRRLGGLLFAIAVGTYFVYPMLIIFSMSIVQPDPNYLVYSFSDNSGFSAIDLGSGQTTSSNVEVITNTNPVSQDDLAWYEKILKFANDFIEKYIFIKLPTGEHTDMISYTLFRTIYPGGFLDSMARITVWLLVPFIISLYALVLFIKGFSEFVGGEVDIAGLSRLL
jgi:hypothetical protein